MWQKARILDGEFKGRTHWVKVGRPECLTVSYHALTHEIVRRNVPRVESNLYLSSGPIFSPSEHIELLPEFADEVPLLTWDEFLKGESK